MKMYTEGFNSMRDVEKFINSKGLQKDAIVSILQSNDGTFFLLYYDE